MSKEIGRSRPRINRIRMYLHVVEKRDDGSSCGCESTSDGSLSSHELIILPTRAKKGEEEFAIAFAIHQTPEGYSRGRRSSLDTRNWRDMTAVISIIQKYAPTVILTMSLSHGIGCLCSVKWSMPADLVSRFPLFIVRAMAAARQASWIAWPGQP